MTSPSRFRIGIAIASLVMAALACNFSASTANVKNLRLASDKDGNSPTTKFGQQDTIFLLGDLANAPSDTKLKATWIAVDVQGADPNSVIDEADLTSGDGTFTFTLQNNQSLWPPGKYRVDLYLDDKLNQSLDYQVEQTAQPALNDLFLSANSNPNQATTSFDPEDIWNLNGELVDAPVGADLRVVWSAVKVSGDISNGVIDQQEQKIDTGKFSIPFRSSRQSWPAGQYSVDVYLNGGLVKTIAFEVAQIETPTPTPQETGAVLENVYMARDQAGKDDTNVFAITDSFYLLGTLSNAPQGGEVEAAWSAVDAPGYKAGDLLVEAKSFHFDEGGFYVSLAEDGHPWKPGTYKVDISLNGQPQTTRDFMVSTIQIKNIYMAWDAKGAQHTSTYTTRQIFYLDFDLSNAPDGTKITTDWYHLGATHDQDEKLNETSDTFKSGSYYFSLTNNNGEWTPGNYEVDLYLNDYYYTAVYFKVQ
jgi:hypothetical protein